MRTRMFLALSALLVLALSSCSSSVPSTTATETPTSAAPATLPAQTGGDPTMQPLAPTQEAPVSYPEPEPSPVANPGVALYPDPQSGDTVRWVQAESMILNGEVQRITQAESLRVILDLRDGRSLISDEPVFDEVANLVRLCGEPCKDVEIVNE